MDNLNNASLTLDKAFTTHPPPSNLNRGTQSSKLSIQKQSGSSTTGKNNSTEANPKDSISTKASEWVQIFKSTSTFKQRNLQQTEERPATKIVRRGMSLPYSTGPEWSKKVSKPRESPNMMMSQMEITEKCRRLVSPILASTMALVQSFQLPVQCSNRKAPYIESQVQFVVGPPVQSLGGTGIAVQPAPHILIRSAQYSIDHPVRLVQCLMMEALVRIMAQSGVAMYYNFWNIGKAASHYSPDCSSDQGTFKKAKWQLGFKCPSSRSTLKTNSDNHW
jgi:hypothetical protein